MLRGVAGALLGGCIGAAIWAGIAYATGYEVGWIALGVGGLAGLGMRLGLGGDGNANAGAVAAIIALAAVALGKFAAVSLAVGQTLNEDDMVLASLADIVLVEWTAAGRAIEPAPVEPESIAETYPRSVWSEATNRWNALSSERQDAIRDLPLRSYEDYIVAHCADLVVLDRQERGETVSWPAGTELGFAWHQTHYPADVWQQGIERLAAMAPNERAAFVADVDDYYRGQYDAALSAMESEMTSGGFMGSFGPYDLLWGILALMTAFRVASPLNRESPT